MWICFCLIPSCKCGFVSDTYLSVGMGLFASDTCVSVNLCPTPMSVDLCLIPVWECGFVCVHHLSVSVGLCLTHVCEWVCLCPAPVCECGFVSDTCL